MLSSWIAALLLVICSSVGIIICQGQYGDPIVTLSHGGRLRGTSRMFNDHKVDLFLGVRYAEAPVNNLRFKKPQEVIPWTELVNAQNAGNVCTQNNFVGVGLLGDEDCLFLDITVPGGVQRQSGTSKAVMLWIHGGGFIFGSGSGYIGAPLATTGDVIVVTINYRLGIFGFLSDGEGTGNFGLWDQRAALLWVRKNIVHFGGDPDNITLFGESAGGSSVAAQTLSLHNSGLFKRAIQQSGSLFLIWSWYLSSRARHEVVASIRVNTTCSTAGTVYNCFNGLTTQQVYNSHISPDPAVQPWHPVPDKDFFPSTFETDPSYELSKRFDLMSGMNGQEGAVDVLFGYTAFAAARNEDLSNGISLELANDYLEDFCATRLTPLSPSLCAQFIISTYRLDLTRSNKDRAVKLSYFLGEISYNAGITNQLKQHSESGNTSTYAYQFNELYYPIKPTIISSLPVWLKRSATHTEELPFLFGAAENLTMWQDIIETDWFTSDTLYETLHSSFRPFSENIMKMWTNFAKTGNPNTPAKLDYKTAEWPEFSPQYEKFLSIASRYSRVIGIPNKERLKKLERYVLSDNALQVRNDMPTCSQ